MRNRKFNNLIYALENCKFVCMNSSQITRNFTQNQYKIIDVSNYKYEADIWATYKNKDLYAESHIKIDTILISTGVPECSENSWYYIDQIEWSEPISLNMTKNDFKKYFDMKVFW